MMTPHIIKRQWFDYVMQVQHDAQLVKAGSLRLQAQQNALNQKKQALASQVTTLTSETAAKRQRLDACNAKMTSLQQQIGQIRFGTLPAAPVFAPDAAAPVGTSSSVGSSVYELANANPMPTIAAEATIPGLNLAKFAAAAAAPSLASLASVTSVTSVSDDDIGTFGEPAIAAAPAAPAAPAVGGGGGGGGTVNAESLPPPGPPPPGAY